MTAKKRIEKLLEMAKSSKYSKRYVQLAKKIGTRTRTRVPKEKKQYICKSCGVMMVPGRNATVRTAGKTLSIRCGECGETQTTPLK